MIRMKNVEIFFNLKAKEEDEECYLSGTNESHLKIHQFIDMLLD